MHCSGKRSVDDFEMLLLFDPNAVGLTTARAADSVTRVTPVSVVRLIDTVLLKVKVFFFSYCAEQYDLNC